MIMKPCSFRFSGVSCGRGTPEKIADVVCGPSLRSTCLFFPSFLFSEQNKTCFSVFCWSCLMFIDGFSSQIVGDFFFCGGGKVLCSDPLGCQDAKMLGDWLHVICGDFLRGCSMCINTYYYFLDGLGFWKVYERDKGMCFLISSGQAAS